MIVLKGKIARELAAIEEQFDQALERSFGPGLGLSSRGDRFRPAIDVFQTSEGLVIRADLAGVDPEHVRLVIDGEYIQISGLRSVSYERIPTHHLQMEIPQGEFERVVRLPIAYDADAVTASFSGGILSVTLPSRKPETRRVPVSSE